MRNVIQGFDENLSIKANKSTVQESITALDEKFVFQSDLKVIDDRFSKVLKKIESQSDFLKREFDLMRKEQLQEVERTVDRAVDLKLVGYEKVAKMFKQFFTQEDLGAIIDRKADLEIVRRLYEHKAGINEIVDVRQLIKGIEDKLRHMSVL